MLRKHMETISLRRFIAFTVVFTVVTIALEWAGNAFGPPWLQAPRLLLPLSQSIGLFAAFQVWPVLLQPVGGWPGWTLSFVIVSLVFAVRFLLKLT